MVPGDSLLPRTRGRGRRGRATVTWRGKAPAGPGRRPPVGPAATGRRRGLQCHWQWVDSKFEPEGRISLGCAGTLHGRRPPRTENTELPPDLGNETLNCSRVSVSTGKLEEIRGALARSRANLRARSLRYCRQSSVGFSALCPICYLPPVGPRILAYTLLITRKYSTRGPSSLSLPLPSPSPSCSRLDGMLCVHLCRGPIVFLYTFFFGFFVSFLNRVSFSHLHMRGSCQIPWHRQTHLG